ncbi:hypothetical protein [Nitrosomonas sp.]|uniref:hypothetical protein n=1 Tax=Nitrosomonas sp. TaxID=42353 RepID=UPI001D8645B5|nr:hypothetical protein [Nitrosomonas sp.]MBX3617534.1 hypothetical protein [Nitrosomonas sp.]
MNREFNDLKNAANISVNLDAEYHQSIRRIKLQLRWLLRKTLKLNRPVSMVKQGKEFHLE